MLQCILSIARSELHTSKKLDQFWMDAMNTNFESCCFTFLTNDRIYFLLRFFYHLFDSCRMNTSVYDQLLQSNSRYFTANRIKSGENYCFRCIINNQFYTCQSFECTYITTLSSNNPSLHLIIRKLNNRNGGLCYMIGSASLDSSNDIFLCLLVCLFLCLRFHFFYHFRSVMFHIVFNSF